MFAVAYTLLAIGNIKPYLAIDYPSCFGSAEPSSCNKRAVNSAEFIEILGVIVGMLAMSEQRTICHDTDSPRFQVFQGTFCILVCHKQSTRRVLS